MLSWNEVIEFNNKHFPEWDKREIIYYSNALAGETGEVCNKVKKFYGGGTHKEKITKRDIVEECVDVYVYLVLLVETLGYDEFMFLNTFDGKLQELYRRMAFNSSEESGKNG